ncbi:bssS family protein [Bordetella avium]|uniref:bssS family protein n=1 Tax=Bordetella avium TaxID=521 RepID=UPI000FD6DDBF|nr:bssS family protein [Bordetella avium]AZY52217.1 bssS family protein [Bordetella avium]
MNENEIPLFPVAAWEVGPLPTIGLAAIKFDFLTNPSQPLQEANPGRHYVLTPIELRALIRKLEETLHVLETSEPTAPQGPQH